MIYDVILSQEDDKYIARAKEWPEVTAIENSRNAAIPFPVASLTARFKPQLLDYLTNQVEVVQAL